MNHILKDYLSAAGVKHTHLYADNVFYSNPNRENLLGLKQMLSHYGMETTGFRVVDKKVKALTFPCILHVEGRFVVAIQHDDTHIIYIEEGKKLRGELEAFRERWDGYALMPTHAKEDPSTSKTELSTHPTILEEPDYEEHRRGEWMEQLPLWGGAIVVGAMMVAGNAFVSLTSSVMVMLAVAGFVFSFFLAEKEVTGESHIGNKLCKALGKGMCKKNGGLWGDWTLSEVGLGYFGAQVLALSVMTDAYMAVAAISMFALLFCPWSVVVQWKMKQWCGLCLLVVAVLVLQGCWSIYQPVHVLDDLPTYWKKFESLVVLMIALGVVIAHLVVRGEQSKVVERQQRWAFQAFRTERAIFETKLKNQPQKPIEARDITQHEGNPDAPHRLTLVTAANCPHCQAMIPSVKRLMQHCHEKFSLDYIVLSDMTDERRKEFILRTGIHGIPTLLVDGYELPDAYNVDDLLNS